MPSFDDDIWSEAIHEAWSTSPSDVIVWETLEFVFSVGGGLTAARFVLGREAITATLEASAPVNGGEAVSFSPAAFEARLPAVAEAGGAPVLQLTTLNVGREMASHLMAAAYSPTPVQVIYRLYTSTDVTAPHQSPGPLTMDVFEISATAQQVTASARWDDLAGRRFPRLEYTQRRFPALAAR